MKIRKAQEKDCPRILELLGQIANFHAEARPDILKIDTPKYDLASLQELMADKKAPIFVVVDENDDLLAYCMCEFRESSGQAGRFKTPYKYLWIEDLCVDETLRGQHIGEVLLNFAKDFAKSENCSRIELNVWEFAGSAEPFYEKEGFRTQERRMEYWLNAED